MRTLKEIKQQIGQAWTSNATLAEAYGFEVGADFDRAFSSVSVEAVLLNVVAMAQWLHEHVIEAHRVEVEERIAAMRPHTLRWYTEKARAYQHGHSLLPDTDRYAATVEEARVVRFVAGVDAPGMVRLKVAGMDDEGQPTPLDASQMAGLRSYMNEVRDAGVEVVINSDNPERLHIRADIYYNPQLLHIVEGKGLLIADGSEPVREAIRVHVRSLPFNGELSVAALCDCLQACPGVEQPVLTEVVVSAYNAASASGSSVDAYYTAQAGYFELGDVHLNYIAR